MQYSYISECDVPLVKFSGMIVSSEDMKRCGSLMNKMESCPITSRVIFAKI